MSGNYLIRAVGLDLGSTSGGMCLTTLRESTWQTSAEDAAAYTAVGGVFVHQIKSAYDVLEYVKRHKPDIVGIEDLKNRGTNRFSKSGLGTQAMGILHGMVRTLLWQAGVPFLEIHVSRYRSFAEHTPFMAGKSRDRKDFRWSKDEVFSWVEKAYGLSRSQFSGSTKECEDMADAIVHASIAACFYAGHWLKNFPPMDIRRKEMFYTTKSVDKKGMLDLPYRFLIRNPAKEPEWQSFRRS